MFRRLIPLVVGLACLSAGVAAALLPATASADATLEGPPEFSAAPGLPDGRVYEQVSPADKNGNEAGGSTTAYDTGATDHYGLASPDGNAVLFEGTGPIGESPSGLNKWFVATKKPGEPGWGTRSLLPAETEGQYAGTGLDQLDPSSDLSHAVVLAAGNLLHEEGCGGGPYLTGPDPFVAATWLRRPAIEDPIVNCQEHSEEAAAPVGGTPDFSTVYFTYAGTLLLEDAERALHSGTGSPVEAWGFYENAEGVLREAGVLPADSPYPGKPDPFGAVPAASGRGRNPSGNEISADGSRAFFVSPDPGSCEPAGQNDCTTDPPELYVRENGEKTLLVSQDTLLPQDEGLHASAPGGVLRMPNPVRQLDGQGELNGSYVFASPDGSQAFFQSASALTKPAEEASLGSEPKTYDFDVDTGGLTYLPGVVLGEQGEILATDSDGSSFAFVRPEAGGELAQLELWSAGPNGGSVAPVTQLPEYPSVPEARMSSNGSVLVFQTAATIAGFNNRGSHTNGSVAEPGSDEIYRYDVPANTLGCVSCAPAGVTPRENTSISVLWTSEFMFSKELVEIPKAIVDERGISTDGDRIFFESSDPLVPQDSNTDSPAITCGEASSCPQGRDVYEWENGVVYLISTGRSPLNSYLLDSSANGNDVFFATAEGLVPGDTDGGYDIYDARIPHEGEPYPPKAVPCEGPVCQGPPNVPSPLTPPASATFSGLGNPTSEVAPAVVKPKATSKATKCKKGFTKKKNKCVKNKKKTKAKKSAKGRA